MNIVRTAYAVAIIAGILAITANTANADTEILLGAKSRHIVTKDANEDHHLIAVKAGGYIAARFINSNKDLSFVAGKVYEYSYGVVEYGAIVGLVTGYSKCAGMPCPTVVPYISTSYEYTPIVLLLGDAVVFSFKMDL